MYAVLSSLEKGQDLKNVLNEYKLWGMLSIKLTSQVLTRLQKSFSFCM